MTKSNKSAEGRVPKPATAHERRNARPQARDLRDPKKVWQDAETTPFAAADQTGGDRVADAGDVGGGATSPYREDMQADIVGKQTTRIHRRPDTPEPVPARKKTTRN